MEILPSYLEQVVDYSHIKVIVLQVHFRTFGNMVWLKLMFSVVNRYSHVQVSSYSYSLS